MAKKALSFTLSGFDKMLENLEKAGKDADKGAKSSIKECADIYKSELTKAVNNANIPHIADDIKAEVKGKDGVYSAKVGWDLSGYDPKNLSSGYKAIFNNYGTVRRQTRNGQDRGQIEGKQFIAKSKKQAKNRIKKSQEEIIKKVMEDLE